MTCVNMVEIHVAGGGREGGREGKREGGRGREERNKVEGCWEE